MQGPLLFMEATLALFGQNGSKSGRLHPAGRPLPLEEPHEATKNGWETRLFFAERRG